MAASYDRLAEHRQEIRVGLKEIVEAADQMATDPQAAADTIRQLVTMVNLLLDQVDDDMALLKQADKTIAAMTLAAISIA